MTEELEQVIQMIFAAGWRLCNMHDSASKLISIINIIDEKNKKLHSTTVTAKSSKQEVTFYNCHC